MTIYTFRKEVTAITVRLAASYGYSKSVALCVCLFKMCTGSE